MIIKRDPLGPVNSNWKCARSHLPYATRRAPGSRPLDQFAQQFPVSRETLEAFDLDWIELSNQGHTPTSNQ